MTIELSCGLPPGSEFSDLAVLAKSLGYSRVWIFDSAPLWEDPFVHLALAAERTSRIALGTAVLIPHERSEMAMASAIATIARLSGGRFRACFGTGATARRTMGHRPLIPQRFANVARRRLAVAMQAREHFQFGVGQSFLGHRSLLITDTRLFRKTKMTTAV